MVHFFDDQQYLALVDPPDLLSFVFGFRVIVYDFALLSKQNVGHHPSRVSPCAALATKLGRSALTLPLRTSTPDTQQLLQP